MSEIKDDPEDSSRRDMLRTTGAAMAIGLAASSGALVTPASAQGAWWDGGVSAR